MVDLSILADMGLLDGIGIPKEAFLAPRLNDLMAFGKPAARALRQRLCELLSADNATLRDDNTLREDALLPLDQVVMHLPVEVGDYTDFYSSREHATNVGSMFRDPANALMPNWLHLPVGYHGRASSIIPSGTPIHRPMGQTRPDPNAPPVFGPTKQLDFELEMGFITFPGKPLGERIEHRRGRGPHLRPGALQRLERTRHPSLGICAARAFPRQELRISPCRRGW